MKQVIGGTETGSNFLGPVEVERREPLRIIGWQALRVEANAKVEGQAASHGPSILQIKRLGRLRGAASIGNGVTANEVVTELPTAESIPPELHLVLLNDRVAGRRTCERGIRRPPDHVDHVCVC